MTDSKPSDDETRRLRDVFLGALDLKGAERTAYLDRECAGAPELRANVEELLHSEMRDDFLEPPVVAAAFAEVARDAEDDTGIVFPTIEGFELEERIGSGGMGAVFRARDVALDRTVALKVVDTTTSVDGMVKRFEREGHAAAKLDHPSIVPIHGVGSSGSWKYLSMEFVDGWSVDEEIRRHASAGGEPTALPAFGSPGYVRAVAQLCRDIAAALEHAHDHSVVHRDVKPHNIVLEAGTCRPVLVDFGIAKDETQGQVTATGDMLGSLYYMSPEQARAQPAQIDHRTDVYSLGVVLYELLTLRRPFPGESATEVIQSICEMEPPPIDGSPATVPRDLVTIVFVALAKDVDRRYPRAGALGDDLDRWLAGEPIKERRESAVARSLGKVRRGRVSMMKVAAGLVVVVVALVLALNKLAEAERRKQGTIAVSTPMDGELFAEPIDPRGDVSLGPRIELGDLPSDEPIALEAGVYSLAFETADAFFERTVAVERQIELPVSFPEPVVLDDDVMASFEGGTLEIFANAPDDMLDFAPGYPALLTVDVKPFELDTHEVTNAEYRAFVEATNRSPPSTWPSDWDSVWDDLPVVGVDFADASTYAAWVGKRLPTMHEYQFAARGPDALLFPWGNDGNVDVDVALPLDNTFADSGWPVYARTTRSPENFGDDVSPERPGGNGLRVYHLAGNVREWTSSMPYQQTSAGVFVPFTTMRSVVGGAWSMRRPNCPAYLFIPMPVTVSNFVTGFRCARSLNP